MSQVDLLSSFWKQAPEIATFTLNHVLSKLVQKTPYEIWIGKCPSLSFMKIQGYQAYVKCQASNKLRPKFDKCYFVGYVMCANGILKSASVHYRKQVIK